MPGEEESTATLTEEDVAAEADRIRDSIVGADMPDLDDEAQPDSEVAPDEAHPTESETPDAASSGTPTDEAGASGTGEGEAEKPKTDEEVAAEEAAKAEAAAAEAAKAEDDAVDALLGIAHSEPADSAVWKDRHSEATRTIHEQAQEMDAMREALRAQGREFITTADGYGIAVSEDAKDFDVNSVDLSAAYRALTTEQLEGLADGKPDSALRAIAENIRGQFASAVAPITARPQDAILTDAECRKEWASFCDMRRPDGKVLYPDADKPDVMKQMENVFNNMPFDVQELAQRNQHVLRLCRQVAYLTVHRWRQAKSLLAQHRKAKVAEQNRTNKKGVAVQGSGSETPVKAQTQLSKGPTSLGEDLAMQIATAGQDDAPEDDL